MILCQREKPFLEKIIRFLGEHCFVQSEGKSGGPNRYYPPQLDIEIYIWSSSAKV